MTNVHIRRGETGDARARISSMEHLLHASKDINDWRFERRMPPSGSPKSMEYVFVGVDKTTGIESPWPMDIVDADEAGSFENEEKRIVSEFATWLQHLASAIRAAKAKKAMESSRLILPKGSSAAAAARALLQKGDHPHY